MSEPDGKATVKLPRVLYVLPTLYCNMSCSYCFTDYHPEFVKNDKREIPSGTVLSFAAAAAIENDLIAVVSGGEPFEYSELRELLLGLSSRVLGIHLTTNGTHLDEAALDWLNTIPNLLITVSCHSRWKFIRELVDKLLPQSRIPIAISQVIEPRNFAASLDLAAFLRERELVFLTQILAPNGDPALERRGYESFSAEQRTVLRELFAKNRRSDFLDRWEHWRLEGKLINGCPFDNRAIVLYASGNVYPCFFRPDEPVGNAIREAPETILARFSSVAIATANPRCARAECNAMFATPMSREAYLAAAGFQSNTESKK